jgi:hypothetical protein
MMDLSKMSEADLNALSAGKIQDVSDAGLRLLAGKQTPVERVSNAVEDYIGIPRQSNRLTLLEEVNKSRQRVAATDSDVSRQLGLTARAGVTGVLGLPTLA